LGYPNTTGLEAMDYRLTDELADPAGAERYYTEKLVRLEGGFLCYGPPAESPAVGALPARLAGRVTFGSFNNLAKVGEQTLELWGRILRRLPGSRLLLKAHGLGSGAARQRLLGRLAAQGIGAERVELAGPERELAAHLGRYGEVDVALDTYPYHGTTTTCEALWMGVPVLTLAGRTHVSRVGVSLLTRAGLAELVAQSAGEDVEKALALAQDLGRLEGLRSSMRERLRACPLMDARAFARSIEAALRGASLR